jgi:hypothetical protein
MDGRAEDQNARVTGKFSTLDWPTPEMLREARRTRARAVRDAILVLLALGNKWAKALIGGYPTSKPNRDKFVQPPASLAHRIWGSSPGVKSCSALLERFQPRMTSVQTQRFFVARPKLSVTGGSSPRHRGGKRS